MCSKTPFPVESESQRIGQYAKIAFDALKPLSWRVADLSGDEDVGLDYHVQIVESGEYRYAFHVQLKGSNTPSVSKTHESISVRLKSRTINYYKNITDPVMLVFCDLSSNDDPRRAIGYYAWIHDELKLLTTDSDYVDDEQQTHTIHVPLKNTFSPNLDVSDYCLGLLRRSHASKGVFDAISEITSQDESFETIASTDRLAMRIREGGRSFLDPVLAESSTPWVNAPEGSIVGQLSLATDQLKKSNDGYAAELLEKIAGEMGSATFHEQAEYQYLLGSISSVRGRSRDASNCYKTAHRIYRDEPKYIVAWIEEKIKQMPIESYRRNFSRLTRLLPSSDRREVVCLKSKLLAGMGQYDQARDVLNVLPAERRHVSLAMIHMVRGQWSLVQDVCKTGLEDQNLLGRQRAILRIFNGRALFEKMLKEHRGTSDELWVPLTGPTGVDPKMLNECWLECHRALKLLRQDGWPLEIEHLAEFLPIPAVALNHHRAILEDVRQAASTRPHLVALQACLERLALASGEISVALEAIDRQPESKELDWHAAYLSWEAGDKQHALEIARKQVSEEPCDVEGVDPRLLVIGAVSANDLLASAQEEEFVNVLESNPQWAGELAVYKFLTEISDAPLKRSAAMEALLDAFERNRDCELLQGTLFRQLDTRNKESAGHFVSVVEQIRLHRELELSDVMRLAEAYFTLEKWPQLNELADDALERFGERDELVSIKALGLECRGETAAALTMLEPLIQKGKQAPLALDVYINIAIRCGYIAEAISIAIRLFERAKDAQAKLEVLRLLFVLKMTLNASSQELFEIAWRYGDLASQEDEVQEGLFLQLFLTATLDTSVSVEETQRQEFQDRLSRYCTRFPESNLLRSILIPANGSPSELVTQLEKIAGFDDVRKNKLRKLVRDLHHQRIGIPFSWRPRNVLLNVGNVFHLWEISKNSSKDEKEYHLTMFYKNGQQQRDLRKTRGIPLLDMLSLIVLHDLDLWSILFSVFDKVAVAKATMLELQSLCVPMLGWGFSDRAREIVEQLQDNMNCIVQPGSGNTGQKAGRLAQLESVEEFMELSSSGEFVGYSDDACIRSYVNEIENAERTICTFDLLQGAEIRGLLSTREVACRVAKLARWNVIGVPVSVKHFLSVFPSSIDSTEDPLEIVDVITSSSFADMAESLWDYKTPYVRVVDHVAQVLVYMCRLPTVNPGLMPALWRVWLDKVRLRTDAPGNQIEHLARSMTLIGSKLGDTDSSSVKRLWDAYKTVVELEFGKEMEERKEIESIEVVGRTMAKMVGETLESVKAERPMENLRSGFVEDTLEYSRFLKAYEEERVRLGVQTQKRDS